MKAIKHVITLCTCIAFGILYFGSAKQPAAIPPPPLVPIKFDFTPPAASGTPNDITFALVRPRFSQAFSRLSTRQPFSAFAENMGPDFLEILHSRGFSYIDPIASTDEMVYADKKNTDLILEVEVDLNVRLSDAIQVSSRKLYYYDGRQPETVYDYYFDGPASVSGKINLVCLEPFTNTKIWVKSIAIPSTSFDLKSFKKYPDENVPFNDPLLWNTLVANLEVAYTGSLQAVWNQLDPQELLVKKGEADEIKKNSGFIKN